jgi:hypothetical protein
LCLYCGIRRLDRFYPRFSASPLASAVRNS